MSLINDALRQASKAHREQTEETAGQPESPLTPLQPVVEAAPMSPWPSLLALLGVALVVLGLIAGGGWLVWKAVKSFRAPTVAKAESQKGPGPAAATKVAATTAPKAAPQTALAVVKTNQVAAATPSPVPPAAATPVQPAVTPAPAPAANPAFARVPPPPKWPSLKLQGIFYQPPNSSVLINSKMLYEADDIQGVKIASIARNAVTLSLDGYTNVILLR
jgi:hypothetical protein